MGGEIYDDCSLKKTTEFAPQHLGFRCFPVSFIQADQLFGGAEIYGVQLKRSLEVGFSIFIPPGCDINRTETRFRR